VLLISAVTGQGLNVLIQAIARQLVNTHEVRVREHEGDKLRSQPNAS
jgi:hypothetical protein